MKKSYSLTSNISNANNKNKDGVYSPIKKKKDKYVNMIPVYTELNKPYQIIHSSIKRQQVFNATSTCFGKLSKGLIMINKNQENKPFFATIKETQEDKNYQFPVWDQKKLKNPENINDESTLIPQHQTHFQKKLNINNENYDNNPIIHPKSAMNSQRKFTSLSSKRPSAGCEINFKNTEDDNQDNFQTFEDEIQGRKSKYEHICFKPILNKNAFSQLVKLDSHKVTTLPYGKERDILEALIRDFYLNLVPENTDMLFCRTENGYYQVYFRSGKVVPHCNICFIPVYFEFSKYEGFNIKCLSGFCDIGIMYSSMLTTEIQYELFGDMEYRQQSDILSIPKLKENTYGIHNISKLIQSGEFKKKNLKTVLKANTIWRIPTDFNNHIKDTIIPGKGGNIYRISSAKPFIPLQPPRISLHSSQSQGHLANNTRPLTVWRDRITQNKMGILTIPNNNNDLQVGDIDKKSPKINLGTSTMLKSKGKFNEPGGLLFHDNQNENDSNKRDYLGNVDIPQITEIDNEGTTYQSLAMQGSAMKIHKHMVSNNSPNINEYEEVKENQELQENSIESIYGIMKNFDNIQQSQK